MKCPCKDCERRSVGCHGKCDDYKEWKNKHDAVRQKERQERQNQFGNYRMGNRIRY